MRRSHWMLLLHRQCAAALFLLGTFGAACGESTAPSRDVLVVSGPDAPPVGSLRDDAGFWHVSCGFPLDASLRAGSNAATAVWTGATIRWHDMAGRPIQTESYTGPEVAEWWGSGTVDAGEPRQTSLSIWAPVPFRATIEFSYRIANRSGTASHTIRCGPEQPLSGRYVLTSINGERPFLHDIEADTLTFFSNLTYVSSGSITGGPFVGRPEAPFQIGPSPYTLPDSRDAGTLDIPVIYPGAGGGRTVRSGTTLTMTLPGCCGRPDLVWRFELQGTVAPAPLPSFVVTPDALTFTAVSGGPLPDEQRFQLRSSTSEQITEVSFGTTAPAPGEPTWIIGINGSTTPTTIFAQPRTTSVAPGTYVVKLTVTSRRASGAKTIDVMYNVIAP